jgi:hypothetical protein
MLNGLNALQGHSGRPRQVSLSPGFAFVRLGHSGRRKYRSRNSYTANPTDAPMKAITPIITERSDGTKNDATTSATNAPETMYT